MATDSGELVFRPSRRLVASQLGGAGVLAALAVSTERNGGAAITITLAMRFFGLGCWALAGRRFRLHLSPSGFEYGVATRHFIFLWSDVAAFGVCPTARGPVVGSTLANPAALGEQERRHNRRFGGFDGYLPAFYGHPAGELAARLEEWRRGAGPAG